MALRLIAGLTHPVYPIYASLTIISCVDVAGMTGFRVSPNFPVEVSLSHGVSNV